MTAQPQSTYTRLTLDDLGGIDAGRRSGNNRRFACPVHGGDHQLSLSIVDDGDMAGVGTCHSCKARVIITDYPGRQQGSYKKPTLAQQADKLFTPKAPRNIQDATPAADAVKLREWHPHMLARASDARALGYLAGRGLPLAPDDIDFLGVATLGYIPFADRMPPRMGKWADRIMFPLWSPAGRGYAGRCIWGWRPGMDENEHKRLLNGYAATCEAESRYNEHRRWEKSNPAGWYCADGLFSETVIIVEGPLDRLALLASGCDAQDVIALVGTAISADSLAWLPRYVKHAVIAFDGDEPGQLAASDTARLLKLAGIVPAVATPPNDSEGKDASERYRHLGAPGLAYIWDAYSTLFHDVTQVKPQKATPAAAATIPSAAPEISAATPETTIATMPSSPRLDPAIMRQLFACAPWYVESAQDDAPALAARWACIGKGAGIVESGQEIAALLYPLFAAGEPVTIGAERQRWPLDLLVVKLRAALASGDSGMLFALATPTGDAPAMPSTPKAQSYGRRVNAYIEGGLDFFTACATVTAENLASLSRSS